MAAYGTYTEGNTYFATRLYVSAWTGSTDANKTIALAEATMRIDRLRFHGVKVDEDQVNEFPRYALNDNGTDPGEDGETTPDDIQYACFEVAMALLDGRDPDIEFENLTVQTHQFDKISNSLTKEIQQHTLAGIPSVTAWRYLLPYLAARRTLKITRVS